METQSAMLLTEREWDALANVCRHYLGATLWAEDSADGSEVRDRRRLCERVVDASENWR
jgi:hypothetical protein